MLRNIGIISHINAGKTTTTERILYYAGKTIVSGDVDKGNTVTDYLVQERDRGITVTSSAVSYNWRKHGINLIDTPGHVDFTIEVERSLSVLDGTVTILDSSAGVEAQTMTVWRQASKYKIPSVIYLNKYDKPAADYKSCLSDLRSTLQVNSALVQMPVILKGNFSSIIDIINRKYIQYGHLQLDKKPIIKPLQDSKLDKKFIDECEELREELVNRLSDIDDDFSSHVLECSTINEVSSKEIEKSIRIATTDCKLSPTLVGSSFKHVGVQSLMDAIVKYLPSPEDRREQLSKILECNKLNISDDFFGFIFKIIHSNIHGPLSFMRIYNGSLNSGRNSLFNIKNGLNEIVKNIYKPFGDELTEITHDIIKDDIVILTGLKDCKTGDIMVKNERLIGKERIRPSENLPFSLIDGVLLPDFSPMEPVYFCTIECPSANQQNKFELALECMTREDPSFKYEIEKTGYTVLRGMGKLHLEMIRDRIETEYGIKTYLGPLQVAYVESIEKSSSRILNINKTINGINCNVHIELKVKPSPGAGKFAKNHFKLSQDPNAELSTMREDRRLMVERGIMNALAGGPIYGAPVVDLTVILMNFKANYKCTSPVVASAASQCLNLCLNSASPVLYEPLMYVEIVVPASNNRLIMNDISSRRGSLLDTVAYDDHSKIGALVPLVTMADYAEYIRVATSGKGTFTMELSGYSKMSESDIEELRRL